MIEKIKNISSRRIIMGTALALVALFLAKGTFGLVTETAARKNGSLEYRVMSVQDMEWSGIENRDGVLITTDLDPQLATREVAKFSSLKFYMEYTIFPGEMVVYYMEPGDAGFSANKRVWLTPVQGEMGWYTADTSMKTVSAIRIDPTMYAGNQLTFGDFIFNEEKTVTDYFEISAGDIFNLFLYTGIISSVLKFLQEMLKKQID